MSAQYALRPIELCDLPTLKRWRALPSVQAHLRHPNITWFQHLKWWWRVRKHSDPTCRAWAVVDNDGVLVGQAGLYYRRGYTAEVSILVMDGDREDFTAEYKLFDHIHAKAKAWGISVLWAEVLTRAPLLRHAVFPMGSILCADTHSTVYRWRIA